MIFPSKLLLIATTLVGQTYSEHNNNNDSDKKICNELDVIEGDIDPQLTGMKQDDPIVIEALKNYYLDKPNNFPLKLADPNPAKVLVM